MPVTFTKMKVLRVNGSGVIVLRGDPVLSNFSKPHEWAVLKHGLGEIRNLVHAQTL